MKAACLLTDSMYSLVVSDNGGVGAENGTLGRGFANLGAVVGGDGMTRAGSTGRGGVLESGSEFGLLELTLVPEQALKLVPEQGLVLLVVAGLLQTSWHPTRGPVFLWILLIPSSS